MQNEDPRGGHQSFPLSKDGLPLQMEASAPSLPQVVPLGAACPPTDQHPKPVQSDDRLREIEEQFRAFVMATSDVVYRMSPDWGEMWQLRGRDLLADTDSPDRSWLHKYIHPDDQPHVTAAINHAIQSKSVFELEHRVLRADGSLGWAFSRAVPLTDASGEIAEWFGTAKDITDRKQAEEALRQATDELTRSNKDLEQFAYAASHDLQEPLRTIKAFLDLLVKQSAAKLDDKDKQYLDFVTDGASRMQALIADLLAYSRAGSKGLEITDVSLGNCVQGALGALARSIQEANAIICLNDLPMVKADPTWITQVFQNLIANAVKFRRKDVRPEISISASREGSMCVVCVRDNGIGIPADRCEGLFEPFNRLHTRQQYAGTGIGLALCKKVIERHGGRIWAESDLDEGSSFFFTVPVSEPGATAEAGGRAGLRKVAGSASLDMRRALEEESEARKQAENAQERLLALMDHNPSLVFLKDECGRYVYMNAAYQRLCAPAEEWRGKTDDDFWTKESAELFRAHDAEVLKSGVTQQFLEDSRDASGKRYCWLCYKFPFTDSQGARHTGGIGIDATQRVLAEEALRALQSRTESILGSITDAFVAVDPEWRFTYLNAEAERVLRRPASEMLGRDMWTLFLNAEAFRRRYEEAIASRKASHFEEYYEPLATWFEVHAYPGTDGLSVYFRDVSERRRTAEALRQSEERLRLALDAANLATWDWHIPSGQLVWNDAHYRILGYEPGSVRPECGDWSARVHPDDLPRVQATLNDSMVKGGEYADDYRALWPDGTVRWLSARGRFETDSAGKAVRFYGVLEDFTDHKAAEEALRQRAEEVERLLEAVPAAVWVTHDPHCRTIIGNRRANEFYEAALGENVSATTLPEVRRFFTPEGRELPAEDLPMQKAMATNQDMRDVEVQVQLPSGRRIDILGSAVPLRDPAGNPRGCIATFLDITQRKAAEEALQRHTAMVAAINRVLEMALGGQTEEEMCQACLGLIEEVTGSVISFIGEIGPDGFLQDLAISNPGWDACKMYDRAGHRKAPSNFPIHGIYGRVLSDGKGLIVNDPASHPDRVGLPEGHPPLASFLGVPLWRAHKVIGMIAVGNRKGGYHVPEQEILEGVAPAIVAALDRKRAEAALRESEERYRRVVENTSAVILRVGIDGVISFANQRALELFGYSADELIGKHAVGTIVPERETNGRDLATMVDQIAADPDAFHTNANENICKDGRRVWLEWTNSGLYDPDGTLKGFLSVGIDATARKEAEAALHQSEEQFRVLTENLVTGVAMIDENGKFTIVNKSFLRMFDLAEDADLLNINSRDWSQWQVFDEAGRFLDVDEHPVRKAARMREAVRDVLVAVQCPGRSDRKWLLISAEPILDANGNLHRLICTYHNVTGRRAEEERLRQSEQRLAKTQEIAHVGSWEFDLGRDLITWSEQVYRIFGLRPDEFGGTNDAFLDRVHPEDRSALNDAYEGSIRQGRPGYELKHRIIRKDTGEIRWVQEKCEHVRDGDGRVIRSLGMVQDITERKQAEQALQESEQRLRLALDAAYLISFEWDIQRNEVRRLVSHDPALQQTVEDKSDTLEDVVQAVHPDDRERFKNNVKTALEREDGEYENEFRLVRPNGQVAWLYERGRVEHAATGQPVRLIGLSQDITERKQAEQSLRHSERLMRTVIDLVPHFVFAKDRDGRFLFVNRAMAESCGMTPEEMEGRYERDLLPDASATESFLRDDREVIDTGQPKFIPEEIITLPNHSRRILQTAKIAFTPPGCEQPAIMGVAVDITDQKQAEQALRESHDRLKKVLEVETVGVMFWDLATGCLVDANDAFLKIMGYTRQDVEAHDLTWQKFTPLEYHEVSLAEIRKFQTTGRVGPYEKEYLRKDGTRQWLVFAGSSLGGNQCVEFCVDIADRKKAEQALRQAVSELERSNKELEQFAYISAHDLQEPLRQVCAYANRLRDRFADKLDDKALQYLEFLYEGASRMSDLVSGLLAYGRVRTPILTGKPVSVDAVLDKALVRLSGEMQASGAVITRDSLPAVAADEQHLTQLFENLISNAIKFRPEGVQPQVHIGCGQHGGQWVFSVRDNGIGIELPFYEKIFQIFQRLHTRQKYPGAGIGLSICKKIVEQHGGRIWVEPSPGGGSTFLFNWPQERK